jgi:hypothetical protein
MKVLGDKVYIRQLDHSYAGLRIHPNIPKQNYRAYKSQGY